MTKCRERAKARGFLGAITVLLTFAASPAHAVDSPGDWGFPLNAAGSVPAGHKINWHPRLFCNPVPSIQPTPDVSGCRITPNMKFEIKAEAGAKFLNTVAPQGSPSITFPLQLKSPVAGVAPIQAGQCTVMNDKSILCETNIDQPAATGTYLETSYPVVGLAHASTCEPSFQAWWYDPAGEPQRGRIPATPPPYNGNNDLWGKNDFLTIKTIGRC